MGRNYMPEVAKMLGLEIGEEFDILYEGRTATDLGPFKFTNETILDCNGDGLGDGLQCWRLCCLLTGDYTLQKRPWRPKTGEDYWHVKTNGVIDCESYEDWDVDLYRLSTGNCFRTIGEAEANKQKILDHFEQIRSGELRLEEEE